MRLVAGLPIAVRNVAHAAMARRGSDAGLAARSTIGSDTTNTADRRTAGMGAPSGIHPLPSSRANGGEFISCAVGLRGRRRFSGRASLWTRRLALSGAPWLRSSRLVHNKRPHGFIGLSISSMTGGVDEHELHLLRALPRSASSIVAVILAA
jgi:hypothetical protein